MEFNLNNANELLVRNYTSTEYKEKYITFKQFLQHVFEDFCFKDRIVFNQACADLLKRTLIKENEVIRNKGFTDIKHFLYNFINEKDPKDIKKRLRKRIEDKDSISLIEFYTQIYYPVKKKKKKKVKCSVS
jgi:ATP-dependent exoDNAse (exonuclease V) beta subunit